MKKLAIFALAIAAGPANADIFKCQLAEKTVYQSQPCPTTANNQRILDIKEVPPEKMAETEQRLDKWETEFAAREAAEREAQAKQAEIDALRRNAKAQEDLAKAERQPIIINQTPVFIGRQRGFRGMPPIVPEAPPMPVDRYKRPPKTNW